MIARPVDRIKKLKRVARSSWKVFVLYLERTFEIVERGTVLDGAVQIQRLEGSRFVRGGWSMGVE